MHSPLTNQPPLNIARFTGFFIESVLTGIYWVHFYSYIEGVQKHSKALGENLFKTPMFAVGATLFIAATGHFLVLVISSFIALANCVDTDTPLDQRGYLSLNPTWSTAYNAFYIAVPVVADAFLIYRVFIVWERNLMITIPAACFCISVLITGSVGAHLFTASAHSIFDKSRRWIVAAFALTFACNIYCTFFIALRVALAQRRVKDAKITPQTKLQKYIEILVQSAALYCLLVCLSLVFSVIESNALYMSVAATSPVIGICFCMIVTRPYNSVTGQTMGAVTSVPHHPWHGIGGAPVDEPHTIFLREPPAPSSPRSGRREIASGTSTGNDPEKALTVSPSDGRPETSHVLGRESMRSGHSMLPATESSDGGVFDEEKIDAPEPPTIN